MTKLLIAYSLAQALTDASFLSFGMLKAFLLAGAVWWLCSFSMWSWNRRYPGRLTYFSLCACAAFVTLISTFFYECLGELQMHALKDLGAWQRAYQADTDYEWKTFVQAYSSLQDLYRTNGWAWDNIAYPQPPAQRPAKPDKYTLPTEHSEARETSLKVYVSRATENLMQNHPVLYRIVSQNTPIKIEQMPLDLAGSMGSNPDDTTSLVTKSMRLAADFFIKNLKNEVNREVFASRVTLVALFLMVEGLIFGLACWAAYSNLKNTRQFP